MNILTFTNNMAMEWNEYLDLYVYYGNDVE